MKTFDPDDPMLTAFALGELEGDELREVEALLARDPAAARHVESIRAAAAGFGEAFEREPALDVEPIRSVEIEPKRRTPFIPWLFYASTAAAACFFIVLVVRLADPAAVQSKDSNLAAEATLPVAPPVAEPVDEVSGTALRQQPALLGKEKAAVSDMAVAQRAESESLARKREMDSGSARERDDSTAVKAAAPSASLGEMKDAAKSASARARANEGEMRSLDSFVADADKGDGGAVLEGYLEKLDAEALPASIDTAALLAELGFKEPETSPGGELGNVAGQMAASPSPMPDPEAALVRAVEGFARLVGSRTPAGDEAWERVLADARYAAGSDPKRLEFVALIGRTRDAIAATAR